MGRRSSTCALAFLTVFLCSMHVKTVALNAPQRDLASDHEGAEPRVLHRDERFFNFIPFIVVRVPEVPCNGTDGEMGTCFSRNDCANNGGTDKGSCAGGYGVCCVFQRNCGQTTRRNNTFLVNDNYPQTFSGVSNCFFGIEKMNDNICQIRLDFVTLTLAGPENTNGECATDTLAVTTSQSFNPPVICGENTGQHMYIEVPDSTSNVRINIATGDNVFDRSWRIKVTQIPCNSPFRAPRNCLQYFTMPTGTIQSFNYVDGATTTQQLADQSYAICIRVQEGFCSIKYKMSGTNSFSLSGDAATPTTAVGSANCPDDYLGFFTPVNDRFCGSQFDEIESSIRPFIVHVETDDVEPATDINNIGFRLDYSQNPC